MDKRDEFSESTKDTLAKRASFRCSMPLCRAQTVGPGDPEKASNVGIAAHIHAASKRGPRYNPDQSSEERKSLSNGIWLCAIHGKTVDDAHSKHPAELLRLWKSEAEELALAELGRARPRSEELESLAVEVARQFRVTQRDGGERVFRAPWISIVHPLQRANHFVGRSETLDALQIWWQNKSKRRCWAFRGLGGSGKTAIIERFAEWLSQTHDDAAIFVWSFYDDESVDRMMSAMVTWQAGSMGRKALVLLDGLERVQSPGSDGDLRGSIPDKRLKAFLRRVVSGHEACSVLITSRYPVVDLKPWEGSSYQEDSLEHLSPEQAVELLKTLGVRAPDDILHQIAGQCGHHALTLTVWGAYIYYYHAGEVSDGLDLDISDAGSDLPEAAALKRCLAEHAILLSSGERQVMFRLAQNFSSFSSEFSPVVIRKLQILGLVSVGDGGLISVHPALRDFFVIIADIPKDQIREVVYTRTIELEEQPGLDDGECGRCGEIALLENAYCEDCGVDVDIPGEPESVRREDGHVVVYFEGARGDSYALHCPECESTELSFEFGVYCSYCEHMSGKDD
ncbi:MAG: hypothetical protein H0T76_13115 [Nannocystis sp.]|nr:hypothetical protein [Nannocystis sp.]MBA3547420.1 hypothetical protein [Nannocystis sp.]